MGARRRAASERMPRKSLFEDCQLLPQRGILQCDLFVAGKGKHDEPNCAENRPEHDATLCLRRWRKSISWRALPVLAKDRSANFQSRATQQQRELLPQICYWYYRRR